MRRFVTSSVGIAVLGLLCGATPAAAQLNSTETTATLTAVLSESLSVTLLPSAVTFTLTSGSATNAGSTAITATTSWALAVTRTNVALYGYFSSASAALAHTAVTNTVDIPSSRVEVSVNGGANAAFNQTVPFGAASAGRQLFSQAVTVATANSSRTDTLALNIDLSSYSIPADTYTGTLRIRAQATP
jgi:hypothetical protein